MIENKKYIIFDLENTKVDSLLLADLKAYGYKMMNLLQDAEADGESVEKADLIHETLNQLFHYKGHRKAQVVFVGNQKEMLAAAKESELTTIAIGFGENAVKEDVAAEYVATSQEALRALLIDEAELQAIREGAKMPKDGPTSTYVRGKDAKGNGENRTNAFAVVWAFLYPFLLFFFVSEFLGLACGAIVDVLATMSETIYNFVLGVMVVEVGGDLTPNGEALLQIPTLLLSGLVMYLLVGGKRNLNAAREEAKELSKKNVAICTGITLVMALGLNFCFMGFGLLQKDVAYAEYMASTNDVWLPLGLVLFGVVVPLVEELVYRGIIFNAVKGLVKPLFAAVISAVLFAYGHAGWLGCVYAFIIGFMFAYAYHHTRRFWIPVMMHSIINIVVYLLGKAEVFKENTTLAIIGLACAVLSAGFIYFKKERP